MILSPNFSDFVRRTYKTKPYKLEFGNLKSQFEIYLVLLQNKQIINECAPDLRVQNSLKSINQLASCYTTEAFVN